MTEKIQFKTDSEWGQWAREQGFMTHPQLRTARRLAAVATGRGKILQEWQEAIEQGKGKNWTRDEATSAFVNHLAKTGRGVSRSTLYTWWGDYEAVGISGLVDGRSLDRAQQGLPQNSLASKTALAVKAAELAKALQDAGVRWEMTIDGVKVRGLTT